MIAIKHLDVSVGGKTIISDLNLTINPGEVHAIMGPNGSGKTTLAYTLARHPDYQITNGGIEFQGKSLLDISPEECACLGLFLSFQHPVAIPGLSTIQFIKSSVNAIRKHENKKPLDAMEFLSLVKAKLKELNMSQDLLYRSLNDGFSGGEKKRNEVLQMSLLEPKLSVIDELDSGLDIDALKDVAKIVNKLRDDNRSFLLITHYQRLLNYIEPDFVHVMLNGKIIHSGNKNLPLELEKKGYEWLKEEQDA